MQFHDKTAYVWMGILPLKKRVNCDKCSFATKQRMFGVFAIEEPGSPVPALFVTLIARSKQAAEDVRTDLRQAKVCHSTSAITKTKQYR